MTDNDMLHKIDGFTPDMTKSIFPAFAVNVPMPRDTAVPGSYTQTPPPSEQSGSNSK